MTVQSSIQPIGLWKSLLYFGIPMILMRGMYYLVMHVLDMFGFRLFYTFFIGFGVPSLLMLIAAWFFWKREKSGLTFRERFRLEGLNGKALIWTIILTAIWISVPLLVQPLTDWVQIHWFAPNKLWIRLMTPDPNYFMEVPKSLFIFPVIGAFILLNVFGGELFFRGYVFPRQELAFGRFTWLYHALFWIFFRSFLPWELPVVVVIAFAIAIVVQLTRNTWPAIISHAVALIAAFVRSF